MAKCYAAYTMTEIASFVERYSRSTDLLSDEEFERLRRDLGLATRSLLDAIARYVAHEYASGRLPFQVADELVNELWEYAVAKDPITGEGWIPDYFDSVYVAFDSGEYLRADDPPGTDPAEKYTRTAIAAIIAREEAA